MKNWKKDLVSVFGLYAFLIYAVFCIAALIVIHQAKFSPCLSSIFGVVIFIYSIGIILLLRCLVCHALKNDSSPESKETQTEPTSPNESRSSFKLEVNNEEIRRGNTTALDTNSSNPESEVQQENAGQKTE
jgi:hypothetical protein